MAVTSLSALQIFFSSRPCSLRCVMLPLLLACSLFRAFSCLHANPAVRPHPSHFSSSPPLRACEQITKFQCTHMCCLLRLPSSADRDHVDHFQRFEKVRKLFGAQTKSLSVWFEVHFVRHANACALSLVRCAILTLASKLPAYASVCRLPRWQACWQQTWSLKHAYEEPLP